MHLVGFFIGIQTCSWPSYLYSLEHCVCLSVCLSVYICMKSWTKRTWEGMPYSSLQAKLCKSGLREITLPQKNHIFTRQCTYNVTLRRDRVTTVAVEKYYICWVCVCRLMCPARNEHASYCHLSPVRLCSIFPHYIINGTIFEREKNKLLSTKYTLWFSLQLLSVTFLILRITERSTIGDAYWSSCSVNNYVIQYKILKNSGLQR